MRTILAAAVLFAVTGCAVFPPELDPPALPGAEPATAGPVGACTAATYEGAVLFNGKAQVGTGSAYDGECSVNGSVEIGPNATEIELVQARSLKTIGVELRIVGASKLTVADFPNLTTVGRLITIDSSNVTKIGFPALTSVEEIVIQNNAKLASIDGFGALPDVGAAHVNGIGNISITHNAVLLTVNGFGKLVTANTGIRIASNASLTSIGGLTLVASVKTLEVSDCPKLTTMKAFTAVTKTTWLGFMRLGLTSLSLPNVTSAYLGTTIQEMPVLTQVDFSALKSGQGGLIWNALPLLHNVDLPALTSLGGGKLSVTYTGIVSMSAKQLDFADTIDFSNNPGLKTMAFPKLVTMTGAFSITGNATLDNLDGYDALKAPAGYDVCGNPMVPKAAVDAFHAKHAGGKLCN